MPSGTLLTRKDSRMIRKRLLMDNDELAAAIEYARGRSGTGTETQKTFTQHVKDLVCIQRERAAWVNPDHDDQEKDNG